MATCSTARTPQRKISGLDSVYNEARIDDSIQQGGNDRDSRYGIAIYMCFRDHAPPHFHAIYGRSDAEVEIATGDILKGKLPTRARRLVREWSREYQRELAQNWDLARAHQPLRPIPPLE